MPQVQTRLGSFDLLFIETQELIFAGLAFRKLICGRVNGSISQSAISIAFDGRILAKRITFLICRHQDTAQISVPLEDHTEHVINLAFQPI
jgi:hypothetical protein